jgi:hypothetical protein
VSRHPLYGDTARAVIEAAIRLQWGHFLLPVFLSPLFKKTCWNLKKEEEEGSMLIC